MIKEKQTMLIFLFCLIIGMCYNSESTYNLTSNTNFVHHHNNNHHHRYKINQMVDFNLHNTVIEPIEHNQPIFINQSNNIYILAKYGQTISLPCMIYRLKSQDSSNAHVVWNKLAENQRPTVLSVGLLQLKQDMRYRVKMIDVSKQTKMKHTNELNEYSEEEYNENGNSGGVSSSLSNNGLYRSADLKDKSYQIENWQFEIRKLTYEDAGTYQCLLPLVKPVTRNITLQVIPDLIIEPKEGNFRKDETIVIKCKATLKSHHRSNNQHSKNNLNQRQQKPHINWYKDNEIIKSSPTQKRREDNNHNNENNQSVRKIEIQTKQDNNQHHLDSVLIIHKANSDDSGKYRCIYDNIQEQITVKVVHDQPEHKSYLTSNAFKSISNIFLLLLLSMSSLKAVVF